MTSLSAFEVFVVGRVVVVLWQGRRAVDMTAVLQRLTLIRSAQRRPLLYVAVIPESVPVMPDELGIDGMRDFFKAVLEHCEALHLVIEGQQPQRAVERARSLGALLGTGDSRRVHVARSEADLLAITLRTGTSREVGAALAVARPRAA